MIHCVLHDPADSVAVAVVVVEGVTAGTTLTGLTAAEALGHREFVPTRLYESA